MIEKRPAEPPDEKRREPRHAPKKFHSVEMKLAALPIYVFKLKDVSENGACFMVKEESAILEHLQVGLKLNMRYHTGDNTRPAEVFNSEIRHITKALDKPYAGHYLVGILILEKQVTMDLQDES